MSLPPDNDRTMMPSKPVTEAPGDASGMMETGNNALPAGTRLGEFEITGLIGEGGFGIVYLAYDHSLQRNIALKEYMPSALATRTTLARVTVKSERQVETFQAGLRSFINEARLLARFDHPSLVKVYRFWEDNGTAYMVMPFYQGATLKETLHRRATPPDEAWLKNLLAPLLDALDVIHHEQCFHRDIAPDNILILDDGRPLLLDFGAARRAISGMTQAFTVILKQGYAPIEQYAEIASMQQGAWTDIYALASVVYFAITGSPPTPAVARMVSDPHIPLSRAVAGRYSEAFLRVIDQALSVRPENRPQSVAELRILLGLEGEKSNQTKPASPELLAKTISHLETTPAPRDHLKLYIGVAVTAIAISGVGYFFIMKDTSPARNQHPAPPLQPPVVMAVPPATKPFDPIQALDDIFQARNREHAVTVSVEKAQVLIGKDQLRFSIRSSKPGYVYLLMVGTDRSQFWLLFPNTIDKDNHIFGGKPFNLPRKGWSMGADGPAGTDQFVAIVSDSPRDFYEAGLKDGELFAEFPLAAAAQLQQAHSGMIPLFAGKANCISTKIAQCSESFGAAVFSIEEVRK